MHKYVYTMQGNSGKSSPARTTFKNKGTGVWVRSTKALICELWTKVSVTAQGIIPPARCFPPADGCSASPLKGAVPSTEVTKKNMQRQFIQFCVKLSDLA